VKRRQLEVKECENVERAEEKDERNEEERENDMERRGITIRRTRG
jgi:hypothetical protein